MVGWPSNVRRVAPVLAVLLSGPLRMLSHARTRDRPIHDELGELIRVAWTLRSRNQCLFGGNREPGAAGPAVVSTRKRQAARNTEMSTRAIAGEYRAPVRKTQTET